MLLTLKFINLFGKKPKFLRKKTPALEIWRKNLSILDKISATYKSTIWRKRDVKLKLKNKKKASKLIGSLMVEYRLKYL
ncbi:hypothetical protein [Chryseobacterium sp.]|uniref:hypothetical protein n=1 Tax=Chryseobacterium sp. TaxID=1871047 RepID=UPI00321A4FE0